MKKGFTLIELLSVIIILAIILVIAVPRILKMISDAKEAAYNSQVKLIISAAEKYVAQNNNITFVNNQAMILLKDLQDNKYINQNIKDPRTGLIVPNTTGIYILNSDGKYNYYFMNYVTDGLILHYDGIYNGGLEVHNDNVSLNKEIWNDLSGNNNNSTLYNFDYNAGSGWFSNGLKFDGSNDDLLSNIISNYSKDSYTIEIFLNCNMYRYSSLSFDVAELKLRIAGQAEYWNTKKSDGTYQLIGIGYPTQMSLNTNTYFSFIYNKTENKYTYSRNSVFNNRVTTSYNSMDMKLHFNGELMSGNIYSIRVYDRDLTNNEIIQNYENDKLRFGM